MPAADPNRRQPPRPYPAAQRTVFAPLELDPRIVACLRPLGQAGKTELTGRQFQITNWEKWSMEERITFLHAFVEDTARDPAIAALTVRIFRAAGTEVRNYKAQWAAILKWVQDPANCYYVNEQVERIQSPQYTLTAGHGDCDDCAVLVAALGCSIRLPFRFVISGVNSKGQKCRWIEGVGLPDPDVNWSHIYVCVGWPPFQPSAWEFAEPTLRVPLGWDVVSAPRDKSGRCILPEMGAVADPPRTKLASRSGFGMIESYPANDRPAASTSSLPVPASPPKDSPLVAFAKTIPLGQVASVVLAGVLSFVITQGVIAPRFAKRAPKSNPRRRR